MEAAEPDELRNTPLNDRSANNTLRFVGLSNPSTNTPHSRPPPCIINKQTDTDLSAKHREAAAESNISLT